jgi:hypothetical protein
MSPQPNRHPHSRRTAYIIAKYTVKEGTFRDVIKNIGAGGLFVRTSRKIAHGQSIILEFPLFQFDNTVEVSGKVVRTDFDGFAVAFDALLEALNTQGEPLPEIVHEINR